MTELARLEEHLARLGRVLLGYSGGVDSALLAVVATRGLGPGRFLAVLGTSPSYPASQWRVARGLAVRYGIPLREIATAELEDPRYRANPTDRCYFCKGELWNRLAAIARSEGFDTIVDGTHTGDLAGHRPGGRAAAEYGVRSPLAELGFDKGAVRGMAAELGLPTAAAPASPCLSSRIRYGLEVTPARLRMVEEAEDFLRGLGVLGDLRVRHLGEAASIEVQPEARPLVAARWEEIAHRLAALGFGAVRVDPRGYRRGSLLVLEGSAS